MDAEVLDAQGLGLLPEWVRDFLVVHSPGLFADLGAGVHLPGVDLQVLDLTLHFLELGLAEVGPQEAMRQHAARAGQFVDESASFDHLIGGQGVLVPIAAGDTADDRHDGVAVAEDFLDVMRPVQELDGLGHVFGVGAEHEEEVADAATGRRLVVPFIADVDVVGLNVEDELVLGPLFLERLRDLRPLRRRPRSSRRRPG